MVRPRLMAMALFLALMLSLAGFAIAGAEPGSGDVSYVVRPGDTLFRIAQTHGVTVRQLVLANHIRNPNLIYVGQVLHIPKETPTARVRVSKSTETPTPSPSPTPTPTPGPTTEVLYHVHPGDNLYRIARGHNTTVTRIARRNHIANRNLIYVGQALAIPSARPDIILSSPVNGQAVSSPITVTGQSDTFEGSVTIDVLDRRFRRVGTTTTTGGGMGTYAPFTATVAYHGVPDGQWGYVEAYWQSPQDGSKKGAVTARVRLSTAGTAPPTGRYHVVRWGETLYSIARRYGVTISQIAAANAIRNVNRIYAGQRLIIP